MLQQILRTSSKRNYYTYIETIVYFFNILCNRPYLLDLVRNTPELDCDAKPGAEQPVLEVVPFELLKSGTW